MKKGKNGKKIVIANWKMNPASLKEAEKLLASVSKDIPRLKKTEVVICSPSLYLEKLKKITKKINIGAQNAFFGEVGPFTGEISNRMLFNMGIKYVILGHSERRALGEENADINKKIKSALSGGLTPIVCVGDKERDENHEYFNFVKNQVEECLNGVNKDLISKIIIAYEPVWALSTTEGRKDATSADSHEMNIFIKKILSDKFGINRELPRIIYGGSVNDRNILDFMTNGGIDGVLVGGASLDPKKFLEIISITENIREIN
ncbi:MAG: triose-phosphate isomerase [bacterium]